MIGIYKITSPTGKVYIGQSRDIEHRWKTHKWKGARSNKDAKYPLYLSMNKHGVDSHAFEVVEQCTFVELNIRERYWQDYYNVLKDGLNGTLQAAEGIPKIYSQAARDAVSQNSKKLVHTDETKAILAKHAKERWTGIPKTEQHKRNISASKTGQKKGPMSQEDKLSKSIAAKSQRVASREKCEWCDKIYDKANMSKHLKKEHNIKK
jgi:group I intron endonuclease